MVILISGSGPQDRDETIMNHKPFLVISDHLVKQGIAVYRFDDRGVGKSTGAFESATSVDFASDVEAIVEHFSKDKRINKAQIGLLGHSEGGMIAPLVSTKSKKVAFQVLLAGTALKGSEILLNL